MSSEIWIGTVEISYRASNPEEFTEKCKLMGKAMAGACLELRNQIPLLALKITAMKLRTCWKELASIRMRSFTGPSTHTP